MKYDNNNIATIESDFWVLSNNSGRVFLGGHNNTINEVDANNRIAAGGTDASACNYDQDRRTQARSEP